jgi:homotetrameric cytidine deaminase
VADSLVDAARVVQARAYAPYSRYRVGAALEAQDGRIFAGCNVENVSFGLTICAERAAVTRAVAEGARSFRRVVVVSDSEPPAAPCGACRQVLFEFGPDLIVESIGPSSRQRWSIQELLPAAFSKGSLA